MLLAFPLVGSDAAVAQTTPTTGRTASVFMCGGWMAAR
jgi:hypothetical protein